MPDDFAQLYETAATLMHLLERNRQSIHTTTSSQTTTSHDTPPHTYTENQKQKRQPNEMRDSRDGGSLAGGANSHNLDNNTPHDAQGWAAARELLERARFLNPSHQPSARALAHVCLSMQDVGSAGGQLRAAAALAREGGLAEEEADALEALADVAMMPCRDDHHFTRYEAEEEAGGFAVHREDAAHEALAGAPKAHAAVGVGVSSTVATTVALLQRALAVGRRTSEGQARILLNIGSLFRRAGALDAAEAKYCSALRMLGGVRDVCMPAPPVAEEENTDAPRLHTLAHTAADEETSGASGRVEIASTILELKAEACNSLGALYLHQDLVRIGGGQGGGGGAGEGGGGEGGQSKCKVGGEREAEVWLRRALALSLARIKPESNEGAQAEGEGEAEAEAEGVTCPLTGEAAGHVLATDRVYALYEGAACNLAFCLRRRQRYAEALWEIESALELLPHSTPLQEAHAEAAADSGIEYLRERERARETASERGAAHKTHTLVPAEREEEEASEEKAPPKGREDTAAAQAAEAAGDGREPEAVGQGHVAKSGGGGRQEEAEEEEEEEAAAADGEEGEEGEEEEEEEDRWLAAHLEDIYRRAERQVLEFERRCERGGWAGGGLMPHVDRAGDTDITLDVWALVELVKLPPKVLLALTVDVKTERGDTVASSGTAATQSLLTKALLLTTPPPPPHSNTGGAKSGWEVEVPRPRPLVDSAARRLLRMQLLVLHGRFSARHQSARAGGGSQAEHSFHQALEEFPQSVDVYKEFGAVLVETRSDQGRAGEEMFKRALMLAPSDAELHYNIARVHSDFRGNQEEALGHGCRALKLAPYSTVIHDFVTHLKSAI